VVKVRMVNEFSVDLPEGYWFGPIERRTALALKQSQLQGQTFVPTNRVAQNLHPNGEHLAPGEGIAAGHVAHPEIVIKTLFEENVVCLVNTMLSLTSQFLRLILPNGAVLLLIDQDTHGSEEQAPGAVGTDWAVSNDQIGARKFFLLQFPHQQHEPAVLCTLQ